MFTVGQRVIVETEPELGLGLVIEVPNSSVVNILFSGADVVRRYSVRSAPLKRIILNPGQQATSKHGQKFKVEKLMEEDGLILYLGEGQELWEYDLHYQLQTSDALDHLLAGQWSKTRTYDLRRDGWEFRKKALMPDTRGLVGPRVELLPHQFDLARKVSSREIPRVLLADEVGLGKTIEAGLIYSSLKAMERANRVLVLAPEALVHQWLAELYRRFNDLFTLLDEERSEQEEGSPFTENQRIICTLDFLIDNPHRLEQAIETSWDLLIVDEAHHLSWTPEIESDKWIAARALSARSHGLLLLTATPAHRGPETQFGLLHLVDPQRFNNFEKFEKELGKLKETAQIATKISEGSRKPELLTKIKKQYPKDKTLHELTKTHIKEDNPETLLAALVDRHGTGRVLFRNRRERLKGFPKRELHAIKLKAIPAWKKYLKAKKADSIGNNEALELAAGLCTFKGRLIQERLDIKGEWLLSFLKKQSEEKILLICSNPNSVRKFDEWIKNHTKLKIALFHEDMEVIERDRQAAWFADPAGARMMICSEIGGEGRNFQFSHHLVLFDLPANPDLLEQRIGRLDRIGQRKAVHIHVPYLEDSPDEVLFNWYAEGISAFEDAWNGGAMVFEKTVMSLIETIKAYLPSSKSHSKKSALLKKLIQETKKATKAEKKRLSDSVDVLIDINSYDAEKGKKLIEQVTEIDSDSKLPKYMARVFDHYGVLYEKLDEQGAIKLETTAQTYIDNFPELRPNSEKLVTFDRNLAQSREDLTFLSQDHPMVQGALGLLLDRKEGKASIAVWPRSPHGPGLLLQLHYLLQATAPTYLEANRDLALKTFEVLLNQDGKRVTLPEGTVPLDKLRPAPQTDVQSYRMKLQKHLPPLVEKATEYVNKQSQPLIQKALESSQARFEQEHQRLKDLQKLTGTVSDKELELHREKQAVLIEAIKEASPHLDAVRLVVLQ